MISNELPKNFLPLSIEIPYQDPALLFQIFADQPWAVLLDSADSAQQREDINQFSYIAFDPFETIVIKNKKRLHTELVIDQPFQYLNTILNQFQLNYCPELPLFQGGALGYFSYDLCHYLEEINLPIESESTAYADLAIGLYDVIISFDHDLKKAWIVSTGFPEKAEPNQSLRAQQRLLYCLNQLTKVLENNVATSLDSTEINLASPFDEKSYGMLIKKAQYYILAGDIFEINLSQRFQATLPAQEKNLYALYLKMRQNNPSPFSAYLNLGDHQLLSSSPERFLLLKKDIVSTRPIKGTAHRGNSLAEDRLIANGLINSEKDRAENIMIVDLLRNDLSKVCTPESVIVNKLCALESYPTLHHLVSVIEGQLKSNMRALDLLEACFPGGSVTGSPKIRAMQIIYELEPTKRGPYCGSIGFIGFNGMMDTSIIIRTLLIENNQLSYQAGGAITLDSSPQKEYQETLIKSAAIRKTLASRT